MPPSPYFTRTFAFSEIICCQMFIYFGFFLHLQEREAIPTMWPHSTFETWLGFQQRGRYVRFLLGTEVVLVVSVTNVCVALLTGVSRRTPVAECVSAQSHRLPRSFPGCHGVDTLVTPSPSLPQFQRGNFGSWRWPVKMAPLTLLEGWWGEGGRGGGGEQI